MQWLVTGEQMREIDRRAIEEYGLPGQNLMEAASAFAASVVAEVKPQGQIVVVTGAGNNGGDGWGIARHLAARSLPVKVVTAISPEELQGDAALQFQVYASLDLPWEEYQGPGQLAGGEVIVDALLGTGLRGEVRGKAAEIIAAINAAAGKVVAVDIPSGLPAEFVPPAGIVVQADVTATFGLAKAGLYTAAGRQAAGKICINPIGLPEALLQDTGLVLNNKGHAARGLPRRNMDSHKGSFGHGLLAAGSRGMSGAAMLAGTAALRSGIGLLTIACPSEIQPLVAANIWEALTLPLPASAQGEFSPEAAAQVPQGKFTAAAIGPGCRTGPGTRALAGRLLKTQLPLVIDADGLNVLAPGIPRREGPTVVTPHPGEMARLLACTVEDVLANPLEICRRGARAWGCVVVLKGATTCIADSTGRAALNITGTPGLATGGSGDILTGLILGLLAQRAEPFAAACAATWLLGTASELAARESGIVSQLPRDVLAALPKAINSLHAAVGEYFPEEEI
ncbi:MAG TPA: NAD(P)H-hydrate dehydratase [Bacillota bacterium]|nr:NAD(P)H-hydrate dehydratase [Bacillota bacterium]